MSKARASFATCIFGGILALNLFLLSASVDAMTVVAKSKGGNAPDGAIWYYAHPSTETVTAVFDSNPSGDHPFGPVNVNLGQSNDPQLTGLIEFDVSTITPVTLAAGQVMALIVSMTDVNGNNAYPVAISAMNGLRCGSANTNCLPTANFSRNDFNGNQYYLAIPYTLGTTVRLGLHIKDVCTSYQILSGVVGMGCSADLISGNSYQTLTLPNTTPLTLTFQLQVLDNSNLTVPLVAKDSGALRVRFQNGSRSAPACPDPIIYFPGDSEIFVDARAFDSNTHGTPANFSPINSTIIVARKNNAAPLLGAGFDALVGGNDIVSRVGVGEMERVGGFINITNANDNENTYQLGMLLRDAAGTVFQAGADGCVMPGVKTSQVQGFLSKGNCFIATGAFRSYDAAPVQLLRKFRDQILKTHPIGRRFINWYYSWSPWAGEWLMTHASFRQPVLQALIPLELGAWVTTRRHGFQFSAALLIAGLACMGWALVERARKLEKLP